MRQFLLSALLSVSLASIAQPETTPALDREMQKGLQEMKDNKPKIGIKAGYNIAKITGSTPDYRPNSRNGFTVAGFYSPSAKSGLGYRTEIVFSRQGFEFGENGKTSEVTNDYVYMPHFTTFGIGKFLQLQAGGQMGYLLKSSKETASENKSQDITSFASRLDYGAAFGAEIYLVKHLIIGGRYNVSFGNAYKRMTTASATNPSPIPNPLPFNPSEVKGRNAVINFFVGLRF